MRFLMVGGALLLAGVGSWLSACSCAPPPPPKKALEAAAAVCLGEVTKVEESGQTLAVTFKVEKWWKGGDKAEVTLSTHKDGATCGYTFKKGERYLVYAHATDKDKALRVSLCSRTRTAKEAEADDLKELGEGKPPAK